MASTLKIPCTRCGGSGQYSFHLIRGTVCFGCEGVGFVLVDPEKHAKAQARQVAAAKVREATKARRAELAAKLHADMNALYGPFPDDAKGAYDLMCAVQRATGKTIGDMVQDALQAGL